ncbi:expressed unknown protein [Seminavis robusta]|uniref:J domain-containing protein n=1 Tax=Seminavis robusta TaxID=568900 RepID=A0A9N8EI17_9STRA|nr:expressed unknown protein [Seminavis robusta]|eukprot:Sro1133_g244800.1 n/a (1135) ;mRNA; r:10824-14409
MKDDIIGSLQQAAPFPYRLMDFRQEQQQADEMEDDNGDDDRFVDLTNCNDSTSDTVGAGGGVEDKAGGDEVPIGVDVCVDIEKIHSEEEQEKQQRNSTTSNNNKNSSRADGSGVIGNRKQRRRNVPNQQQHHQKKKMNKATNSKENHSTNTGTSNGRKRMRQESKHNQSTKPSSTINSTATNTGSSKNETNKKKRRRRKTTKCQTNQQKNHLEKIQKPMEKVKVGINPVDQFADAEEEGDWCKYSQLLHQSNTQQQQQKQKQRTSTQTELHSNTKNHKHPAASKGKRCTGKSSLRQQKPTQPQKHSNQTDMSQQQNQDAMDPVGVDISVDVVDMYLQVDGDYQDCLEQNEHGQDHIHKGRMGEGCADSVLLQQSIMQQKLQQTSTKEYMHSNTKNHKRLTAPKRERSRSKSSSQDKLTQPQKQSLSNQTDTSRPENQDTMEPVGVDISVDVVDMYLQADEDHQDNRDGGNDHGLEQNERGQDYIHKGRIGEGFSDSLLLQQSSTQQQQTSEQAALHSNTKNHNQATASKQKRSRAKSSVQDKPPQPQKQSNQRDTPRQENHDIMEPVGVDISVDVVDMYLQADEDHQDNGQDHNYARKTAEGGHVLSQAESSPLCTNNSTEEQLKQQQQLIQKLKEDLQREKEESHKKDDTLKRYETLLNSQSRNQGECSNNNNETHYDSTKDRPHDIGDQEDRKVAATTQPFHGGQKKPHPNNGRQFASLPSCNKKGGDEWVSWRKAGVSDNVSHSVDGVVELLGTDEESCSDEDLFAQSEDEQDEEELRQEQGENEPTNLSAANPIDVDDNQDDDSDEDLFAGSDDDEEDEQMGTTTANVLTQQSSGDDENESSSSSREIRNGTIPPKECVSPSARKISVCEDVEPTTKNVLYGDSSEANTTIEPITNRPAWNKSVAKSEVAKPKEAEDQRGAVHVGLEEAAEDNPGASSRPNFIVIDDDDSDDEVEVLFTQEARISGRKEGGVKRQGFAVSNSDIGKEPYMYVKRPVPPNKRNPSENMFRGDRDFSFRLSTETAQEMQERLLRDCVTRMKSIGEKDPSRIANERPLFIGVPISDIFRQHPDHWKWKDPWARLGLPRHSAAHLVKSHYRKLVLLYHPDKARYRDSTQRFHAITEAYRKLTAK